MGTYKEIVSQTITYLDISGGSTTISRYVGVKNLSDNSYVGNIDKISTECYLDPEVDWITDITLDKNDDTVKNITVSYLAHDGILKYWSRTANLKLKNTANESGYLLLTLQGTQANLNVYLCMNIHINGQFISSSNKKMCGMDKTQFTSDMLNITTLYNFPTDYNYIVFLLQDKQCYYVNQTSYNDTGITYTGATRKLDNYTYYKDEFYNILGRRDVNKDNLYIFRIDSYSSLYIKNSFYTNNQKLYSSCIILMPTGYVPGWLWLKEN